MIHTASQLQHIPLKQVLSFSVEQQIYYLFHFLFTNNLGADFLPPTMNSQDLLHFLFLPSFCQSVVDWCQLPSTILPGQLPVICCQSAFLRKCEIIKRGYHNDVIVFLRISIRTFVYIATANGRNSLFQSWTKYLAKSKRNQAKLDKTTCIVHTETRSGLEQPGYKSNELKQAKNTCRMSQTEIKIGLEKD